MYQTTLGAQHHRSPKAPTLSPKVDVLTRYFREAGYFTANGRGSGDMAKPLEEIGKTDWNFRLPYGEHAVAFDGADWSERAEGQPFYAQINIEETHRPWTPDKIRPIDPETVTLSPYYADHPIIRRDWASYLEEAQILDRKVGKILERLEREGLADSTVVVFFGDNGRPFHRGKIPLYEGGLNVPLIIRRPDGSGAGTVDDRLFSLIDLTPTCLDLAGIPVPEHVQGQIALGKNARAREHCFAALDRVDDKPDRVRAVRTKRFKYLRNFRPDLPYLPGNRYQVLVQPTVTAMFKLHQEGKLNADQDRFMATMRPEEELYDLETDPHELSNLASEPRYEKTLVELRQALDLWVEESNDLGRFPEEPAQFQANAVAMQAYYDLAMKTRPFKKSSFASSERVSFDFDEFYQYWQDTLSVD